MAKTRLSDVVLFETSIDLSKEQRTKMIDLLNERLADTIDLKTQAKHAHWNVKGIQFHQLHQLFDEIAGHLEEHADPAGGSGADSMVLAVGHRANGAQSWIS